MANALGIRTSSNNSATGFPFLIGSSPKHTKIMDDLKYVLIVSLNVTGRLLLNVPIAMQET